MNALGALPNFDVYTYAGNQVPYTPNGSVPVIGGFPQLVTVPQNPNGGVHFTANGNQSGDRSPLLNFGLIAAGLVEVSIDYYSGDWYDNNGGNFNAALTLRGAAGNQGGFYFGRSPSQPSGDVNGNGAVAPQWLVRSDANLNAGLVGAGFQGHIFTNVAGFDNLARGIWHRVGMVYDKVSGELTQLKSQELTPGGNIYTMNNPVGPAGQDLYIQGGAGTPLVSDAVRLYNVGNGTVSGYDNLYVGDPYTWTPIAPIPEPSTMGLVLAGLAGLALARRRK